MVLYDKESNVRVMDNNLIVPIGHGQKLRRGDQERESMSRWVELKKKVGSEGLWISGTPVNVEGL